MMKSLIVAAMVAALGSQALAADMAVKAPPAPPVTSPFWSGFYLGGYGGGVWESTNTTFNGGTQSVSSNPSGGVFGGLIGVNHQIDAWVFGVEGDGGINTARQTINFLSLGTGLPESQQLKSNYDARIRARGGYAFGQFMLFVAGGVTFSDESMTLTHTTTGQPPFAIRNELTGWNAGLGIDYAFTRNWIGRIEYIHDDFGKTTFGFTVPSAGQFTDRITSTRDDTVRAAIIYKF